MQLGSNIPFVLRGTAADMLEAKGGVVYAVAPDETVYAAVARMNDCRIGALLVMDGTRLVGIVSERDYSRKVILLGRASKDTLVREIMSSPVVTIGPGSSLTECMQIMTQHSFRHLPVLQNDQVIGVLSIGDLVRRVVMQQAETIQSLNSFIGADYPA
jgi:CBS domain-containing protein